MQLLLATPLIRKSIFFYFLFVLGMLTNSVTAFTNAEVEECLKDLSTSELLRLTHSLDQMEEKGTFENSFWQEHDNHNTTSERVTTTPKPAQEDESCPSQNCLKPMAMALTGVPREYYSHAPQHSHHSWHPQPEEKPSKLTTLFNITITTLSFLAFGGYLICLIIHAIRTKGATFLYPVTTTASTAVDGGIRKIKVYRRGRRTLKQQRLLEPNYAEFYRSLYY